MSTTPQDTALSISSPPVTRPWSLLGVRLRASQRPGGLTSRFLKGTLLLVVATFACQLAAIAAAPVLTRLYSPADFGVLGMFLAVCAPLLAVICLRYECAIPLPRDDRDALRLVITSAAVTLVFAGILSLLVLVLNDAVAGAFRMPQLANYLWILPWALLFGGWYATLNYWSLRKKHFGKVAGSRATETLGRIATECSLGLWGWQPAGLLLAQGLAKTYGVLVLTAQFPWHALQKECHKWSSVVATAKSYRSFPLLAAPSTIANSVSGNAPCLLLPLLFGPVETGLFLISQRLSSWPITLFGQTVSQVFYSELSSHDVSSREKRRLFYRLSLLMAGSSVAIGMIFLSAPLWCAGLLGDQWSSAGAFIAALTPMLAGQLVVSPFSQAYYVYSKQRLLLALDIVRLALTCAAFIVGWYLSWPALFCVIAFSISLCVLYAIHWMIIASLLGDDLPKSVDDDTTPFASGIPAGRSGT